jgi:hypothetical protein
MMIPPNWWLISLASCQQKKCTIFSPWAIQKTSSPNEFWTSHPPRFEGKDQWMAVLGTPWFHCNYYFCSFETLQNINFQAMEPEVQKRVRRCFLAAIPKQGMWTTGGIWQCHHSMISVLLLPSVSRQKCLLLVMELSFPGSWNGSQPASN